MAIEKIDVFKVSFPFHVVTFVTSLHFTYKTTVVFVPGCGFQSLFLFLLLFGWEMHCFVVAKGRGKRRSNNGCWKLEKRGEGKEEKKATCSFLSKNKYI